MCLIVFVKDNTKQTYFAITILYINGRGIFLDSIDAIFEVNVDHIIKTL